MTFHTFNPSTDTLEVGTKIRLAGREGEIKGFEEMYRAMAEVLWTSGDTDFLHLYEFTFEISDKPAKPRTIDKRVKGEIMRIMNPQIHSYLGKDLANYLNSLEET